MTFESRPGGFEGDAQRLELPPRSLRENGSPRPALFQCFFFRQAALALGLNATLFGQNATLFGQFLLRPRRLLVGLGDARLPPGFLRVLLGLLGIFLRLLPLALGLRRLGGGDA